MGILREALSSTDYIQHYTAAYMQGQEMTRPQSTLSPKGKKLLEQHSDRIRLKQYSTRRSRELKLIVPKVLHDIESLRWRA